VADDRRLTTQEVADLLGVKTQTVYAYASRGLLASAPAPGGKGSTFDAGEVEALAGRRGRPRPRAEAQAFDDAFPMRSAITLSENGRLYYRGHDVIALSERSGFETAVALLWEAAAPAPSRQAAGASARDTEPLAAVDLRAPAELVAAVRRTGAVLPARARRGDLLRIAVTVASCADPLRFDLRRENVLAMGSALIGAMVEALPPASTADQAARSLAARLWAKLAPAPGTPEAVSCLDQALVLLADHGFAASTLAARVAASARANPYAVVSAGLGPLDGPLHGAASGLAYRMLAEVLATGNAVGVISEYLRAGMPIPGLGMRLYPDGDPRARALLASVYRLPGAGEVRQAVEDVVSAAAGRPLSAASGPLWAHANIDLALAALTFHCGMPGDAGEVIFAVARTAGWLAHALEEYAEPPLRLRLRGTYTGPRPS
jgi:citrate synthase